MSQKPVFVATHPRACSTAFERVFMTRPDILQCAHEPFGDAFYYGPERLGERYADDEAGRISSGFSETKYSDVVDRLDRDGSTEGKRVLIKDMAYYLMPPNGEFPSIAPSLRSQVKNGLADGDCHAMGANGVAGTLKRKSPDPMDNPTVIPLELLRKFHWTFLIRHPRRGIPSYVRCCTPPLSETTGWDHFKPSESGYVELRRLFDYLREQGIVGPSVAGRVPSTGAKTGKDEISITVLDADDLLDKPQEAIRAFCEQTDIPFSPDMLQWDSEENQDRVKQAFAKWNGWHNDAINSKGLTARAHPKKPVTEESENEEWREKYGEEGQKIIRACVNENIPHYEYMKSFALKF
ncbi:P-loop containing nucleoside triphosphate hydrolase protein [Nemania sp. NC0429]|nr:P-loop containing nucleoside triphosphate hydrolase protein [Nemania sp. NC0429]